MVEKLKVGTTLEGDRGRLYSWEKINEMIDAVEVADVAAKSALSVSSNSTTTTISHTFPTTISANVGEKAIDYKISLTSGTFAAGVSVSGVTEDGTSLDVTDLDLEGESSMYLSELIDSSTEDVRPDLSTYADGTKTFVLTWAGVVDNTLKVEAVVSEDSFATMDELAVYFKAVDLNPA